jgi:hypothetical protein
LDNFFSEEESDALGVDMLAFFQDLPLPQVLRFTGAGDSDKNPDEIVKDLVDKVHARSMPTMQA